MKLSDKSYLNAKFSLIMAFLMQILANQIDNSTVKWILAITAIVEIVSAVFELVSMVRWQKAEEKASDEIVEKIKEMRKEFNKGSDTLNTKLDELTQHIDALYARWEYLTKVSQGQIIE